MPMAAQRATSRKIALLISGLEIWAGHAGYWLRGVRFERPKSNSPCPCQASLDRIVWPPSRTINPTNRLPACGGLWRE